jgi:hypothetical protein
MCTHAPGRTSIPSTALGRAPAPHHSSPPQAMPSLTTHLQTPGEGPHRGQRSLLVPWPQHDDVPTWQPMVLVQPVRIGRPRATPTHAYPPHPQCTACTKPMSETQHRSRRRNSGLGPSHCSATAAGVWLHLAKWSAGCTATKLVTMAASPAAESSVLKLEPTICFTAPLCRSMQGRNWATATAASFVSIPILVRFPPVVPL